MSEENDKVLRNREVFEQFIKDVDLISNTIGSFRTGEEFLNRCRDIYNDVGAIKKIGLAFNRIKEISDAFKVGLASVDDMAKKAAETAAATIPVDSVDHQPK